MAGWIWYRAVGQLHGLAVMDPRGPKESVLYDAGIQDQILGSIPYRQLVARYGAG